MTFLLTISDNQMKEALRKLKKTEGLRVVTIFDLLNIVSVDCTEEVIQQVRVSISEVEHIEREHRKRAI